MSAKETNTSGEEDAWETKLSKHHIRGSGAASAEGSPDGSDSAPATSNLRKQILDVRGFDSIIILTLRDGFPRPIGNAQEISSQAILVGKTCRTIGCTAGPSPDWPPSLHGLGDRGRVAPWTGLSQRILWKTLQPQDHDIIPACKLKPPMPWNHPIKERPRNRATPGAGHPQT